MAQEEVTAAVDASDGGGHAWHRAVASLIDDLGGEHFPDQLVDALRHLVSFDLATMFSNRARARPVAIYDSFGSPEGKKGIAAYAESTYVHNPFYQALLNGLPDGVYRIRDLVLGAHPLSSCAGSAHLRGLPMLPRSTEEIGYVTAYWPEGLEEVDIAVTPEPGVVIELSIYRSRPTRGFGDDELSRIATVLPVLRALVRRYWSGLGGEGLCTLPPDSQVDDAFATFGEAVLSARERDVTRLILRGHSSESIAGHLGIALGTVKTHRKNAYAKLGICSQSELLSLFLRKLRADR